MHRSGAVSGPLACVLLKDIRFCQVPGIAGRCRQPRSKGGGDDAGVRAAKPFSPAAPPRPPRCLRRGR